MAERLGAFPEVPPQVFLIQNGRRPWAQEERVGSDKALEQERRRKTTALPITLSCSYSAL